MTNEEYRRAVSDIAWLCACAVNGKIPDRDRIDGMDLSAVYQSAERHLLKGITAIALESAGVRNEEFTQALGKAVRKTAAMDLERARILDALEKAGIWYMPMKGSVLQDLYPRIGMRQMADNDILYNESRTEDILPLMESLGMETDPHNGRGVHDHYYKKPVCSFEMHRKLFDQSQEKTLADYYRDVKSRLVRDPGKEFGFHFREEDFYVYMIAHEYKHYSGGGTGLRSLLDIYVYNMKKGDTLDREYVEGELEKLGLTEFEKRNRDLADHLFGEGEIGENDREMLDYILSSGTYGTIGNRVKNRMERYGNGPLQKVRYILGRIFLPLDTVRSAFPVFIRYPVLLPFLPFYRVIRGLVNRRSKLKAEWMALNQYQKKKDG